MTLIYIAALAALFVYAFWGVDSFTGKVVHAWSLDNFRQIFESGPFRGVVWRTVYIAAAVTATCAVLAFPFAYFMARLASPRVRAMLFVLVLLPLWSSYLVRVYAWKVILANGFNWLRYRVRFKGGIELSDLDERHLRPTGRTAKRLARKAAAVAGSDDDGPATGS